MDPPPSKSDIRDNRGYIRVLNPKPQTLNLKPQTLNPKTLGFSYSPIIALLQGGGVLPKDSIVAKVRLRDEELGVGFK